MKLPKSLTTVTPLSKVLAIILFISLPFIGLFLGVRYKSQTAICSREESKEQSIENGGLTVLPERVTWNQIGQEYDVWWDDSAQSLKFKSNIFGITKEFSSRELSAITGKKDFTQVFKTFGINSQDKSLIIAVGLWYRYELPEGGSTILPTWVKYTISDETLTVLPINTEKVLLFGETLFYSDAEYNSPGSISGFNLTSDKVEIKFLSANSNSQLIPVGLSSNGENLIINCFTSESGKFELGYYFVSALSCGDYLGNLKTEKLTKIK